MLRLWLAVVACGMGACSSCDESGAPAGARFDFTNEGSGPANTAPLDPLRDGTYRAGLIVDGTVDLASGRARRLIDQQANEVTYMIDADIGLFVAGNTRGVFAHPILLVPATVREGMAWTVEADTTTYRFVVRSRLETTDDWGKVVEWTITQSADDEVGSSRSYAEGIGHLVGGITVVPLDTPDPEPSKAPRIALEALHWPGEDTVLVAAASAESISMVRAPGHDPTLMFDDHPASSVGAGGGNGVCFSVNQAGATALTPMRTDRPFLRTGPDVCPVYALDTSWPSFHASLTYVENDGTITWMGRNRGRYDTLIDQSGTTSIAIRPRALLPPHDGVHVDVYYEHGSAPYDRVTLGGQIYVYGSQTDQDLDLADPWFVLGRERTFVSAITTDEGDRHMMIVRTIDDMLWLTSASAAGVTTPIPVGRLGGVLSVQTTELGTEILRVTPDGQVDRLHVAGEQLLLEPLARLTVPANMRLDGAFLVRDPAGDRLIAAVLDLSLGGGTKLYRSARVVVSSVRQPIAPHHVYFADAGGNGDVLACLPGAAGVELAGWTLGEQPAGLVLEVGPESHCVLVVRGSGQDERPIEFPVLRGRFPGLSFAANRFIDSAPPQHADMFPFRLAPLTGGGAGNHLRRYGRGLLASGPGTFGPKNTAPPQYGDLIASFGLLPDARGDGLWGIRRRFNPAGTDVVRWGTTVFHREYDDADVRLQAVSQKGGVIANRGFASAWLRLTSDGVEEALPAPLYGSYCTQLADGTLCGDGFNAGMNRYETFCMDSTGGSLRVAADVLCTGAVPLGGKLLVQGQEQLMQLDGTTMTTSFYMDGKVWMAQASDGSIYGVVVATDGALMLYALEMGGPRALIAAGDYRVALSPTLEYQLVVEDHVFMVISTSSISLLALRIPR